MLIDSDVKARLHFDVGGTAHTACSRGAACSAHSFHAGLGCVGLEKKSKRYSGPLKKL